jgi:hypothetical protein
MSQGWFGVLSAGVESVIWQPISRRRRTMIDKEKDVVISSETAKKPYERARIDEHEPLEEATAYVYYYYTYYF